MIDKNFELMQDIHQQVSIEDIQKSQEQRYKLSPLAQFAIDTLKMYAQETKNMPPTTYDLDGLGQWLIIRLFEAQKEKRVLLNEACASIGRNIISPIDSI